VGPRRARPTPRARGRRAAHARAEFKKQKGLSSVFESEVDGVSWPFRFGFGE